MKKTVLFALAALGFVLASCQKDYKCICTTAVSKKDTLMEQVKTTKIGSKGFKDTCVKKGEDSLKVKDCHLE